MFQPMGKEGVFCQRQQLNFLHLMGGSFSSCIQHSPVNAPLQCRVFRSHFVTKISHPANYENESCAFSNPLTFGDHRMGEAGQHRETEAHWDFSQSPGKLFPYTMKQKQVSPWPRSRYPSTSEMEALCHNTGAGSISAPGGNHRGEEKKNDGCSQPHFSPKPPAWTSHFGSPQGIQEL